MVRILFFACCMIGLLWSCSQPERRCSAFKNGTFSFTSTIDGEEKTTTFIRKDEIEVDLFEGKSDTAAIRWINDCEYIVRKVNPKSIAESKSIHMKILTTTANSYTFEYSIVGSSKKLYGTAVKTQ